MDAEPMTVAEGVAAPIAVEPASEDPPVAAHPPAPAVIARPLAKPRKRPTPPTNKDMLKQALNVLGKVEQRLEQLEQEVAGIDHAVRRVVPDTDDDQPEAVGQ